MIFHSMKLRLVLQIKCKFSPGQTDSAPGFDFVSIIGLNSMVKQKLNHNTCMLSAVTM